jgi:aminoglycoside phosphotransferase family enzyme
MEISEREHSEKLAFLGTPGVLDGISERIETHMSWVFLTTDRAFKLKKPIRLPHLDHTTVEQRRQSCEEELRLGRRLAPDVYLRVLPVVRTAAGLALGGDGQVVDWVVEMRRLPAERMLPAMLARGAATVVHADAIGELLSTFYRGAPRAPWVAEAYRARVRATILSMSDELVRRGAPRYQLAPIASALVATLEAHATELEARVAAGRVVDAHGDLRPEHVCLEAPPVIIDPLELSAELRMMDTHAELAFLSLECERLDAGWFGARVIQRYVAQADDPVPVSLVAVYRGAHALTRAVLALRHLDDAPRADPALVRRWRERAADYLRRITPAS